MGKLFEPAAVDAAAVAALVAAHWPGVVLGARLKASQNHTFEATHADSHDDGAAMMGPNPAQRPGRRKYAVRATPDPTGAQRQRMLDELAFVQFLDGAGGGAAVPGVCGPVPVPATGALLVSADGLHVCLSCWADGAPLDFLAYTWLADAPVVRAWGAWFARLHAASRAFARAHPDVAARMRRWDEVHDGVLAGSTVHPDDAAVVADPDRFGVLHGDLNISNFFVVPGTPPALSVFDWDQVQRGWFEFDVAQAALTSLMLHEAGGLLDGARVPLADPLAFLRWLVEGYEAEAGPGAIDRARLARMLALRKHFYGQFCRRAQAEGVPTEQQFFIDYVVKWLEAFPVDLYSSAADLVVD